jgi:hypothetical protein
VFPVRCGLGFINSFVRHIIFSKCKIPFAAECMDGTGNQHGSGKQSSGFFIGSFFDPEDGSDMFLRNVS